jgi:restriction system protein
VLNSALRAELPQRILDKSPTFIDRVIVDLLVAMGYGGSTLVNLERTCP